MKEDTLYLAALLQLPNVGTNRALSLLEKYQSPRKALEHYKDWYILIPKQQQLIEQEVTKLNVDKLQTNFQKLNMHLLSIFDDQYPTQLKNIPDPPLLLYMQGNLKCLEYTHYLGVVGTRYPSAYGIQATQKIIRELSSEICIVSGFQRGIDTVAHQAAIDNNFSTIAVLGTGLDINYPPGNHRLKKHMLEHNLIITENPLGTEPRPGLFPRRNRIISGLSQAVLVVEATIKSGSMVTAKCALDQNRDVFAVPGSIFSVHTAGPHYLISQGAKIITKGEDILSEYGLENTSDHLKSAKVSEIQQTILGALTSEFYPDQLVNQLSLSTSYLLAQLSIMELSGLVTRHDDGKYSRT